MSSVTGILIVTASLALFFLGGLPPLRPDPLELTAVRLVKLGNFLLFR